jgi:DNA polymerase-3 subunit gamma/tau
VAVGAVTKHLESIAKNEGITVEPAALELIASHGEGSFRDSISLLDQLSALTGGNITLETAEQVIGISPHAAIEEIIKHLEDGDTASLQKVLSKQLDERGVNAHIITAQLIKALKNAAHNNPNLYTLIDNLLEVPKSSQPTLKLTVLLLKFAAENEKQSAKSAKAANVHKPALHTVSKTPKEVKTANTEEPQTKSGTKTPRDKKSFELSAWQSVLAVIQKANPPLYSVLSKAEPRLKDSELTLAFGYKLHQKKLDDPKYRTKLTQVINDLGYNSPKVTATIDSAGVTPAKDAPVANQAPEDATTKDIISIMGGGEIVNA